MPNLPSQNAERVAPRRVVVPKATTPPVAVAKAIAAKAVTLAAGAKVMGKAPPVPAGITAAVAAAAAAKATGVARNAMHQAIVQVDPVAAKAALFYSGTPIPKMAFVPPPPPPPQFGGQLVLNS